LTNASRTATVSSSSLASQLAGTSTRLGAIAARTGAASVAASTAASIVTDDFPAHAATYSHIHAVRMGVRQRAPRRGSQN
jgi:hypothetical protein